MWGMALGLALAAPAPAAAGADPAVALKPQVALTTAELRIGDLVTVRGRALPSRVAAMVVLRLPRGGTAFDVPAERAAALVRRRVPGLRPVVTPGAVIQVRLAAAPVPARAAGTCFAAANGLAAGTVLSVSDVASIPCRDEAPAQLRYGRAGLVIAAAAVPAGGYLGRLAALPERTVGKGAPLTLRSTSGPVTIERSVVALQSARSGGRLFVRDAGGAVFAAPLALAPGSSAR